MKTAFTTLVLLSILGSASSTYAQPLSKKSGKAKSSISAEVFATSPLDLTVERLPINYAGHSCRAIAKNLSPLDLKKGEFETTAAYNGRMEAISNAPAVGTTLLSNAVGFVASRSAYSPLSQSYNADRGVLTVEGFWHEDTLVNDALVSSVKLDYKLKSSRKYEGANAYGRTVTVSSATWDTCGLAISNSRIDGSHRQKLSRINEAIEMTADEAREAKGHVDVMYVGTLSSPYRMEYSDYDKPTIDHPSESFYRGNALVMKLTQLWIFNRKTGTVYRKIDL